MSRARARIRVGLRTLLLGAVATVLLAAASVHMARDAEGQSVPGYPNASGLVKWLMSTPTDLTDYDDDAIIVQRWSFPQYFTPSVTSTTNYAYAHAVHLPSNASSGSLHSRWDLAGGLGWGLFDDSGAGSPSYPDGEFPRFKLVMVHHGLNTLSGNWTGHPDATAIYNMSSEASATEALYLYPWLSPAERERLRIADNAPVTLKWVLGSTPAEVVDPVDNEIAFGGIHAGVTQTALRFPNSVMLSDGSNNIPHWWDNTPDLDIWGLGGSDAFQTTAALCWWHTALDASISENSPQFRDNCLHYFFGMLGSSDHTVSPPYRRMTLGEYLEDEAPTPAWVTNTANGELYYGLEISTPWHEGGHPTRPRCIHEYLTTDLYLTCSFNAPSEADIHSYEATLTHSNGRILDLQGGSVDSPQTCFPHNDPQPSCSISYGDLENQYGITIGNSGEEITFSVTATTQWTEGADSSRLEFTSQDATATLSRLSGVFPPIDLEVNGAGGTLLVTWAPGEHDTLVVGYDVEHRRDGAVEWTRARAAGRDARSHNIQVSQAGSYQVRVRAVGNLDTWASSWTSVSGSTSVQPRAPEFPTNFVAIPSNESVVLRWTQPNPELVTGYRLRYRLGSGEYTQVPFRSYSDYCTPDCVASIPMLTNDEEYQFVLETLGVEGTSGRILTIFATPTLSPSSSYIGNLEIPAEKTKASERGDFAEVQIEWDIFAPGVDTVEPDIQGTIVEFRTLLDRQWTRHGILPKPSGTNADPIPNIVRGAVTLDLDYGVRYFIRVKAFDDAVAAADESAEPWLVITHQQNRSQVNITRASMIVTRHINSPGAGAPANSFSGRIVVGTDPPPAVGDVFVANTCIEFRYSPATNMNGDPAVGQGGGICKPRTLRGPTTETSDPTEYTVDFSSDIGVPATSPSLNLFWRFTLQPLGSDEIWEGRANDPDVTSSSPSDGQFFAVRGERVQEGQPRPPQTLPLAPGIYDIEAQGGQFGGFAGVLIRWEREPEAAAYQVRIDTDQVVDSLSRPHGNTADFFGYAAPGHLIGAPVGIDRLSGLEPSADPVTIRMEAFSIDGEEFPFAAMYVDKREGAMGPFVFVVLGDISDIMLSNDAPNLHYEDTVAVLGGPRDGISSASHEDIARELSPSDIVSVSVENLEDGMWGHTPGRTPGASAEGVYTVRTVIRYQSSDTLQSYTQADPAQGHATVRIRRGEYLSAPSNSIEVQVPINVDFRARVRTVFEDGRYSQWSATRRGFAPFADIDFKGTPIPPTAIPTVEGEATLGLDEILGGLGVTDPNDPSQNLFSPFQGTDNFNIPVILTMISFAIPLVVATVTWYMTPTSATQPRVMAVLLLSTATWLFTSRVVGGLNWQWVFVPMIIVIMLGFIAIARRAQ